MAQPHDKFLAKPQPTGKFVMVALILGTILVSIDGSAMSVALPSVQRQFDATSANLQLIMVAYMIAMAACLLPIGAVSDRVGRKPIYITGLITFMIGSGFSATSSSVEILIFGRVVQGLGAAAISGLAIAILTGNAERERVPKIIAMWTTLSLMASTAGPFVGGFLVSTFGWRSVFYFNLPFTFFVLVVAIFSLKDDHKVQAQRMKLTGGLLIALTLSSFTWAIMQMQQFGFTSSKVILPLVISILVLAVLVFEQRHTEIPLVEWGSLLRNPIPVTLMLSLLSGLALSGSMYQMTIFNQNVLGFSPTLAGSVSLITTLACAVLASLAAKLLQTIGSAVPVMVSLLIAAAAMMILAQLNPSSTLIFVMIGLLVLGIGIGIANPIISSIAMQSAGNSGSGAVSGSLGLVGSIGSILGITVMGGVTTRVALLDWEKNGGDSALNGFVGVGNLEGVASQAGQAARELAANSYAAGVNSTFIVGAVILVISALLAIAVLPKKPLQSDVEVPVIAPPIV
jgi:DHA2 family methylenomycin A resistance protein-like MFS transporter